jgi:hypothetical protein
MDHVSATYLRTRLRRAEEAVTLSDGEPTSSSYDTLVVFDEPVLYDLIGRLQCTISSRQICVTRADVCTEMSIVAYGSLILQQDSVH